MMIPIWFEKCERDSRNRQNAWSGQNLPGYPGKFVQALGCCDALRAFCGCEIGSVQRSPSFLQNPNLATRMLSDCGDFYEQRILCSVCRILVEA
jgi:hypothetical protein